MLKAYWTKWEVKYGLQKRVIKALYGTEDRTQIMIPETDVKKFRRWSMTVLLDKLPAAVKEWYKKYAVCAFSHVQLLNQKATCSHR